MRNSKIFFDGVFLSIYSHLLKKLELSKLCRKKGFGALKIRKMASSKKSQTIKKETYFFVNFCFYIKIKWLIKKLHFTSNELIKYYMK